MLKILKPSAKITTVTIDGVEDYALPNPHAIDLPPEPKRFSPFALALTLTPFLFPLPPFPFPEDILKYP